MISAVIETSGAVMPGKFARATIWSFVVSLRKENEK
jgi:hypothetical protein